jgi:FkbM family methyltransferase
MATQMDIAGWVAIALSITVAALGLVCHQILMQNKRICERLQTLERRFRLRNNNTDCHIPPFWRFTVGNKFEAENVWNQIFFEDEYQIRQVRFCSHDVIIDVGAHIGVFSYLCHILGGRSIYAYEPSDRSFQLLNRNLSNLPGIHLFPNAVWRSDEAPSAKLLICGPSGENTGAVSAMASGRVIDFGTQSLVASGEDGRSVSAVPLDQILATFPRVKLLKLDCEGSEFPILLTSRELHRVERIVGEVHEIGEQLMASLDSGALVSSYTAYRVEHLINFLESAGFRVSRRPGGMHLFLINAVRVAAAPR